jgi:hypothetical protein
MTTTRNVPPAFAVMLAPFIAWLATRETDESVRRGYRESIESYLHWSLADQGDAHDRRPRYVDTLRRAGHGDVGTTRRALERMAEYEAIVALTLPFDY